MGDIADVDINDYTKNKKTFTGYYAQIIQRIQALQPRAKIFLVSIPKGHYDKEETKKAQRDLLKKFTEIFTNTYLIDLYEYAPVQDEMLVSLFWNGGHMVPAGYLFVAKMIESYIDYIVRANHDDFKQVGFIGTDLYYTREDT